MGCVLLLISFLFVLLVRRFGRPGESV
jgi:hypothetical protein